MWICLALLLYGRLTLGLLRAVCLVLLLLYCLALLLLGSGPALLLLGIYLTVLILLNGLTLLLLRVPLALLELGIPRWSSRGNSHVAIGCKRPVDGYAGRMAMIDIAELCPVCAGRTLVPYLRGHGRGMLLMDGIDFSGPGSHMNSAGATVETYTSAGPVVPADGMVIDMVDDGDVDVID
jgi:hypothetical protein